MATPRSWYRDGYMISTAPQLIQPAAVNDAFDSDELFWCKRLAPEALKKMLANSLCLGLYKVPEASAELAGRSGPAQIGLARVITDGVTMAYLTDVYVLPEYQGRDLGNWLMQCLREELETWPDLRRIVLTSRGEQSKRYYARTLGMTPFEQGRDDGWLLNRKMGGAASSF